MFFPTRICLLELRLRTTLLHVLLMQAYAGFGLNVSKLFKLDKPWQKQTIKGQNTKLRVWVRKAEVFRFMAQVSTRGSGFAGFRAPCFFFYNLFCFALGHCAWPLEALGGLFLASLLGVGVRSAATSCFGDLAPTPPHPSPPFPCQHV